MKKYDVLIIGSGPAGMNAAVYASRLGLKTAMIEKGAPGGKLVNISKISNWIGIKNIEGPELAIAMDKHSKSFGAESIFGNVKLINENKNAVILDDGKIIEYKFLIIATGMIESIPKDVDGIDKFNTLGVSYCAICDGPIYKGEVVSVIGGGNSAVEEAAYLTSVAKEVHIFVRGKFSAEQKLINELKAKKNIIVHLGSKIIKIKGNKKVEEIITTDGNFKVKAVFPYIGQKANTASFKNTSIKTKDGFIITDENMKTSVNNIYAIGDVRSKKIRQISTAVSDGTIAAKNIGNLI